MLVGPFLGDDGLDEHPEPLLIAAALCLDHVDQQVERAINAS